MKSIVSLNKLNTGTIDVSMGSISTTAITSLKIMEGYDTLQFLLGFSRFSCELGYPKKLLIDEGGQLMSVFLCVRLFWGGGC